MSSSEVLVNNKYCSANSRSQLPPLHMLLERMARVRCLEANSTTEQHDRQLAYQTDEQLTISRKHS